MYNPLHRPVALVITQSDFTRQQIAQRMQLAIARMATGERVYFREITSGLAAIDEELLRQLFLVSTSSLDKSGYSYTWLTDIDGKLCFQPNITVHSL